MKSGKQTCQDFFGRSTTVHNRLVRAHTLHELRSRNDAFSLLPSQQVFRFVHGPGQKSEQKHTTKNFVGCHGHSPL